ncbi:IclR family transcriptional regulator [Conexibacter woesei]|uniref:Transcriptional regulator, IclR family n=1 Tax=Conexibacter woesei (strain DSM 14684 / CCUG 47730 / CIP 108061 / JCM 11494 / NBRC 100937 / ID131577) TaxID=469383 RepID=D3FD86_CONWI|nr:IclR family transcriptional regulator [Conexibacter woesei]ADB53478.1 transcriptional regulator, IclR family [Conexibacter woesei DSM 14684]
MNTVETGTRIQSVARASQLLLWVAEQPHGANAKEIAEAQGLALPTCYHLVNTLVDQGLLAKDVHRRYVLGPSTAILAQAYLRGRSVSEQLLTALRELADRTGETVYLADWGEHDIRVLASVESSHIVRVAEVGSGPYENGHARANGKVLLAWAAPEVRQGYLRDHPLAACTPASITDPDALDRELARIRRRGYAYDQEEYALGVSCIGAPLLKDGRIVAAYGVTVPTERFKKQRRALTDTLLDVIAGVGAA